MTLSSKSKQTLQNSLHFFSIWEIVSHFCPLVRTIQKQAKLTSVASYSEQEAFQPFAELLSSIVVLSFSLLF